MLPRAMSLKAILLVLFISITINDILANGQYPVFFRTDYKFDSDSQAFYKQHSQIKKWGEAVYACELEGAELAAPTTEKAVQALVNQMKNDTNAVFVGIHDLFEEGNFITLNGTPIEETFSKWANNGPSSVYSYDDCVTMTSEGFFKDGNCDVKKNYICKRDLRDLSSNPICQTYDTEYFHPENSNSCYKLHKTKGSWHHAYKICSAEQSHLGILNSPEEAAVYANAAKLSPEDNLHLGFSSTLIPGKYRTIHAQSLSSAGYNVWVTKHNGHSCGAMNKEGKLTSQSCSQESLFICEKPLKTISLDSNTE